MANFYTFVSMEKTKKTHIENDPQFDSLNVQEGIEAPSNINAAAVARYRKLKAKRLPTVAEYCEGILAGNKTMLSKAITLVESSVDAHHALAQEIIERCLPYTGNSIRIGFSGVPGAGKSTTVEAMGTKLVNEGHKLAVLAIDPSSEKTKGSILGDKTRMEYVSGHANAYVRPSPTAGSLGGVAQKTRESMFLCEAAGYDTIFVETVGVGQSEIAVHSMVDFFFLIAISGAGDELQGIKRGIIEMADLISINKADGDNILRANMAKTQLMTSLMFFPARESKWVPEVTTHSALKNIGLDEIWEVIMKYQRLTSENGYFQNRRKEQAKYWMHETINERLIKDFYGRPEIKQLISQLESQIIDNKVDSFLAAEKTLKLYNSLNKSN